MLNKPKAMLESRAQVLRELERELDRVQRGKPVTEMQHKRRKKYDQLKELYNTMRKT
jgi:hypothetical protein